ncbi:UbiX family flavin prenyltransferase, partial [Dehalococcoidia bacterium]|nr:UbiX family flavin prenyltransferase [Dehalococcoidia bacterium]
MSTFVIGITGASGAPYAKRILQELLAQKHHVKLVVSPAGERVIDIELGLRFSGSREARREQWAEFLGSEPQELELLGHKNFAASIASGSFPFASMAVVPCSMGTLSRIAHGTSTNLIERAADVALKEKRPLILVPRETPLNHIHMKNMLSAGTAGAEILPAMPGFYHHPRTIDDLVDMMAGRILERMGVENDLFRRWQGDPLA